MYLDGATGFLTSRAPSRAPVPLLEQQMNREGGEGAWTGAEENTEGIGLLAMAKRAKQEAKKEHNISSIATVILAQRMLGKKKDSSSELTGNQNDAPGTRRFHVRFAGKFTLLVVQATGSTVGDLLMDTNRRAAAHPQLLPLGPAAELQWQGAILSNDDKLSAALPLPRGKDTPTFVEAVLPHDHVPPPPKETLLGPDEDIPLDEPGQRRKAWSLCHEYNRTTEKNSGNRTRMLKELVMNAGPDTEILPPIHVDYGFNVTVGRDFKADKGLVLLDSAAITFGDGVVIGPSVHIFTHPNYLDSAARNRGEDALAIAIGDGVWIGGCVQIGPGVTIGADTVVGAGSVVTEDLPPDSVCMGNPCKVMGKRSTDD